jgi:hypothetical protein
MRAKANKYKAKIANKGWWKTKGEMREKGQKIERKGRKMVQNKQK